MININNKISYSIGYEIEWAKDEVNSNDFIQLEELLNLKLSEEYKKFMEEMNGLYLENGYFYFNLRGKTKYINIEEIFSFCKNIEHSSSIIQVNKQYIGYNYLIPNYMIIGSDGMGLIIYNVENKKVQYWDGVKLALHSEYVHIIDLADSLEDFLNSLETKRKRFKLFN